MMLNIKPNEVKCDLGSYVHYWRGTMKSGKSRLFYDLLKLHYGDLKKGLLIAIGNEIGYKTMDGIYAYETPTWEVLEELVDELVENKSQYGFSLVAFDTVDELVRLATEEVKRLHKKAKGVTVEFNACFGGYGEPRKKLGELINNIYGRLERAGYGIVFIGHTRTKDVKVKNGEDYQKLGSNLNEDYDGIFANHSDIVMTIMEEREVNENKIVENVTRYMHFRSDGFVDCGGRFTDLPDKLEYGAENYLKAFEQGVRGAIEGKITDKELDKRRKAEVADRLKHAEEFIKSEKEDKVDEDRNEEIRKEIKEIASNDDEKKEIFKKCLKDNNMKKLSDEVPTRVLESILEALK